MSKKNRKREVPQKAPAATTAARYPGHLFALAAAALLCAFVYSVSLHGPFLFDDHSYITSNPLIRDFSAFFGRAQAGVNENVDIHFGNRLAAFFTFALNYAAGGPDPAGFRAVNIVLHALNSFLVYWLALLFLGRLPGRGPEGASGRLGEAQARAGAAGAALLFACHPLQTQAVAYISQRFTSLAAFFCLLSLACYLAARLRAGRGGFVFYAVSLLSAAAAMKTKENAFPLPVMLAAAEFLFFRDELKARLKRLLPLALTMLIIPAGLMFGSAQRRSPAAALTAAGGEKPDVVSYALTQPEALVTYLRLLAWPAGQNADRDPPLRRSPEAPVLGALLLLAALAAYGARLASCGERLRAAAGFGVAWFFVMSAVESSFIPLGDLAFEHRAYLPSFGIFLGAGALLAGAARRAAAKGRSAALAVFFLCLVAALAWAARSRAAVWGSEEALWRDAALKSPRKARPHYNLGSVLAREERFAEAAAELELALAVFPDNPDNADVYYNLGLARARLEEFPAAEAAFRAAQKLRPGHDSACFNLGIVFLKQGRLKEAVREFEAALAANPGHLKARAKLEQLRGG